jgi:cbb3-type cytochrome oxidase subunit 3
VIFLIAFIGVVISLFLPSRQRTFERMRRLPIERDSSEPASRREDTFHA